MVLLSGCMFLNKPDQTKPVNPSVNNMPTNGVRQLPTYFMNWWFDQLNNRQSGQMVKQDKKPSKLIASNNDILNTQQLLSEPVSVSLPSTYYDLRDGEYVPSVGYQGMVNDCWAYSTVESLESAMLVQLGPSGISADYPFINDSNNPQLSIQFVAYNNCDWNVSSYLPATGDYYITYQETNKDNGGNHFFSFYDMVVRGIPLSTDFPYHENATGTSTLPYIEWDPTNSSWPQHLVRASYTYIIPPASWFYSKGYSYADYIDTIKSAIVKYGAVAVDFEVYSDFEKDANEPSGWVYSGPSNATDEGGHAVILIGWNDNWTYNGTDYGPVWILQNSWSTYWGHNGYWRQPMISESQYDNPQSIGNWQIEANLEGMYVPIL